MYRAFHLNTGRVKSHTVANFDDFWQAFLLFIDTLWRKLNKMFQIDIF